MQLDATSIATEIVSSVNKAQSKVPGEAQLAAASAADFCGIWVKAKPILELLAGIAIFIPGVGAVAGGVLTALIKVGEQISAQMCKP